MCTDMCVDMYTNIDMCMDMCIDTRMDMFTDMCIDSVGPAFVAAKAVEVECMGAAVGPSDNSWVGWFVIWDAVGEVGSVGSCAWTCVQTCAQARA